MIRALRALAAFTLLFLAAPSAEAAWSRVQFATGSTANVTTAATATFSSAVSVGNLVVVLCNSWHQSQTFAVSDGAGNRYAPGGRYVQGTNAGTEAIYWMIVPPGGSAALTISVLPGSQDGLTICAVEYSAGAGNAIVIDTPTATMVGAVGTGTAIADGSLTLTGNSLVVAVCDNDGGKTPTAGTSFTMISSVTSVFEPAFFLESLNQSAGTLAATATYNVSGAWSIGSMAFRYTNAGPPSQGSSGQWNHVQGTGNYAPTLSSSGTQIGVSATMAAAISVGNVVCVGITSSDAYVAYTLTDNLGNVWTRAQHLTCVTDTAVFVDMWYTIVTKAGVLQLAIPNYSSSLSIDEYSFPGAASIAYDNSASSTNSTGNLQSVTAGSLTLTGNNDLIHFIGFMNLGGTVLQSYTAGSGYTLGYSISTDQPMIISNYGIGSQYKLNVTSGPVSPTMSITSSGNEVGGADIIAFKATVSTGTGAALLPSASLRPIRPRPRKAG